jgi:sulfide:quinone oxidoreductase
MNNLAKGHHQVVIMGGGSAGITVAARLRRARPSLDIAIIEPSERHYYQPLWTLVGAGVVDKATTVRQQETFMPKDVSWIRQTAQQLEVERSRIVLGDGAVLNYDYLVVAPGIALNWDAVAGLQAALGRYGVCSNYAFDQLDYTWETLRNFRGGTAIFTNPAGPVKCGGAPQKIMYLADDYLRRHHRRDTATIIGAFAGTKMLGVPEINATLERIVRERAIDMRFHHNLVAIDGPKHEATFERLDTPDRTRVTLTFDMIHVTPPQSAPDVVRQSGVAVKDGPDQGFAKVDIHTLQSPDYPNVFALGDAAALPTAKTGAAVRKQAPVVVKNLLAVIDGLAPSARYDGYSSCPLVTKYDRLVLAEFVYGNVYKPTFPVDQTRERYDMYLLKRYLLPQLYWHGMLRGRA